MCYFMMELLGKTSQKKNAQTWDIVPSLGGGRSSKLQCPNLNFRVFLTSKRCQNACNYSPYCYINSNTELNRRTQSSIIRLLKLKSTKNTWKKDGSTVKIDLRSRESMDQVLVFISVMGFEPMVGKATTPSRSLTLA